MADIEIEIDGQSLKAEPGQMVIQVADAAGIYIPRFCYHKHLSIAANCRMCLVEVEKVPKALPACATPVAPGMKVFTRSKAALAAQKAIMEFLLVNHPLDCPVCDQGGECELQDISLGFGNADSYFSERKRSVKDKNIGPLISTEMTRCIHCTRCVRFGDEIAGLRELGATGRGENTEIGTYIEHAVQSEISGNVIDLCPVGALTSKPFRFKARAWELIQHATIAPHDCLGTNVFAHTYNGKVMRIVPRENSKINETWIADRDRFSYQGLYHADRVTQPMIKTNKGWQVVSWEVALTTTVQLLQEVLNKDGSDQLAALSSPNATVEEFYLLQKLIRGLHSPHIDFRLLEQDFSDQNNFPLFPGITDSIEQIEQHDVIVLLGSNLLQEQPLLAVRLRKAIRHGAKIIVINPAEFDFRFKLAAHKIFANLADFSVDAEVENILASGKNIGIYLGALALHNPSAAMIRSQAKILAEKYNAKLGSLTFGANTAGAWLAGAIPHRGPSGDRVLTEGLDALSLLTKPRKAYLLLNVEPEDCLDRGLFVSALQQASAVISLAMFQHPVLLETAQVILPIAPFTETSGSFVNVAGEWQSFNGVASPLGESRPAWKVLRVLGNLLKCDGFDFNSSIEIRDELKAQLLESGGVLPASENNSADVTKQDSAKYALPEISLYQTDSIVRRATALQER